jgi:hypothetical protein
MTKSNKNEISYHAKYILGGMQKINSCMGEIILFDVKNSYQEPFDVPYLNYEDHNFEKCENCKKLFENIKVQCNNFFITFPNCCESHAKLINYKLYNKNNFKNLGDKVASKIMFSYHHFINNIYQDYWSMEIENYIEFVIRSFGQFPNEYGSPVGLSQYLGYLIQLIKSYKVDKKMLKFSYRVEYIIEYLESKLNPIENKNKDFSQLIIIYNKWYNSFPFELEFFSPLKAKYAKTIPFLSEDKKYNPYLNEVSVKLITTDKLIENLLSITKSILFSIDTNKLLQDEYITNDKRFKLDIIKKQHSFLQDGIFIDYSKGELKYRSLIKKWLSNEKKFIKEILPYIQPSIIKSNENDLDFENFVPENKQKYILKLLEDLSITNNGISILSQRKKSCIRGVVEGLKDNNIIPNLSIDKLCKIIGNKIGLEIKSKLDYSSEVKKTMRSTIDYIKDNPLH